MDCQSSLPSKDNSSSSFRLAVGESGTGEGAQRVDIIFRVSQNLEPNIR